MMRREKNQGKKEAPFKGRPRGGATPPPNFWGVPKSQYSKSPSLRPEMVLLGDMPPGLSELRREPHVAQVLSETGYGAI